MSVEIAVDNPPTIVTTKEPEPVVADVVDPSISISTSATFEENHSEIPVFTEPIIRELSGSGEVFVNDSSEVQTPKLDIEMAKKRRRGKQHDGGKQNRKKERKKIREEYGVPSGTRVDRVNLPGKGNVPCRWDGKKWIPLHR